MEVELNLENYQWKERILCIFAKSPEDPIYQWQLKEIEANPRGITERDLTIIHIFTKGEGRINQTPIPEPGPGHLYRQFKIRENSFWVLLIGKDGKEKYRDNKPISFEDLFSIIDSLPLRKEEIQARKSL